jgi:ATP-binding cassette, subfamily C (CFTR/MRP), member 1
MAALISVGSSYMGFTTIGLLAALYFLQKIYLRTSRQIRFLDLEAKSPLYTHFFETLEGLSTIRAFGWERFFREASNRALDASQKPYYLMYCIQRWLSLVLQLLIGAMAVLVVGLAVGLRQTTSAGNLGIALTTILSFNTNVQFLLTWWTALETSLGAIARTKNFAEQTPTEDKPGESFVPSDDWPSRGEIELQAISASYGSEKHENCKSRRPLTFKRDSDKALENIVMHIAPGEKIGICGRTGRLVQVTYGIKRHQFLTINPSGKSSLLSVLQRLLDMDTGTILIDGVDLKCVPRDIIRTRLVAVPQDPFLLSGTIRLNADPTGKAPDELIMAAMTKVKLWDIIEARGGLDAEMASQVLSQGQQQLFCLGCALLRTESKILILDEATSSMDLATDRLVQELIRVEFRDHTIITVAHRLETIAESDRVVVLEKGRIVEFENPKTLLNRDSVFKRLYAET